MFHVKHFIIPNVGLFHVKHFGQFTSAEVFASAFIFSAFDRRLQKNPFRTAERRNHAGRGGEKHRTAKTVPVAECGNPAARTTRTTFRRGGGEKSLP